MSCESASVGGLFLPEKSKRTTMSDQAKCEETKSYYELTLDDLEAVSGDEISLSYGTIHWVYTKQDDMGAAEGK